MITAHTRKVIHTTDETGSLQNLLLPLFLTPQVRKGVNDYTKDEVEDNNDDHEKEQEVIHHSGSKQGLLHRPVGGQTETKHWKFKPNINQTITRHLF